MAYCTSWIAPQFAGIRFVVIKVAKKGRAYMQPGAVFAFILVILTQAS
jgi:hypothetical protein